MRNLIIVFVMMLLSVSLVQGQIYKIDQTDVREGSFTVIVDGEKRVIQLAGVFEYLRKSKNV